MQDFAMWSRIVLVVLSLIVFIKFLVSQVRFRKYLLALTSQSPRVLPGTKGPILFKTGVEFKMVPFLFRRRYDQLADPLLRQRGSQLRRQCLIDFGLGLLVVILGIMNFVFKANGY